MITITGASGKTGLKVARLLLSAGENVGVIGRSIDHLRELVQLGAEPLIGDQSNEAFLASALSGADALYLLIPPKFDTQDIRRHYNNLGLAAVNAIKKSMVSKVVFLSSLGAEHDAGVGPIVGLHDVEILLSELTEVDVVYLRAGYFYDNTLMNIDMVRNKGVYGNSANPDVPILMVSTDDIAHRAAALLSGRQFKGHQVEDIFSERITYREVTRIIGEKMGMPDLQFTRYSDEDALKGMMAGGLSRSLAQSFVEMAHGIENGLVTTTMRDPRKPFGAVKYSQFAEKALEAMISYAA